MKIKIRSTLIILAMITLLGGCIKDGNSSSEETKRANIAQKLLHEKYGKDFVVYSIGNSYGTLTNEAFTALCYEKSTPTVRFAAKVAKDGSYMHDEYVSRKVSEKMEKGIKSNLNNFADPFALKVGAGIKMIDSKNANMSPEEFMTSVPDLVFKLYVVIEAKQLSSEEASNLVNLLSNGVKEYPNLNGEMEVYLGSKLMIDHFNTYNSENPNADSGMFEILKDSKPGYFEIEKGQLKLTADELARLST
jgi:hypothetical protein